MAEKTSLQVCEPKSYFSGSTFSYFVAQTGRFYLTVGILFLERGCDVTHGINTNGKRNMRNLFLGENRLRDYMIKRKFKFLSRI